MNLKQCKTAYVSLEAGKEKLTNENENKLRMTYKLMNNKSRN